VASWLRAVLKQGHNQRLDTDQGGRYFVDIRRALRCHVDFDCARAKDWSPSALNGAPGSVGGRAGGRWKEVNRLLPSTRENMFMMHNPIDQLESPVFVHRAPSLVSSRMFSSIHRLNDNNVVATLATVFASRYSTIETQWNFSIVFLRNLLCMLTIEAMMTTFDDYHSIEEIDKMKGGYVREPRFPANSLG